MSDAEVRVAAAMIAAMVCGGITSRVTLRELMPEWTDWAEEYLRTGRTR